MIANQVDGNSKRTSGNSLSPLAVQSKDLCAASQTVLIRVFLSSARRLCFEVFKILFGQLVDRMRDEPSRTRSPSPGRRVRLGHTIFGLTGQEWSLTC